MKISLQDLEERFNTVSQNLRLEELKVSSLHSKLGKYNSLSFLIDKLNKNLTLEDTADTLNREVYAIMGYHDVSFLLYIFDQKTQGLSILSSRGASPDTDTGIENKQGDVFDLWVIRHSTPLLVEDTASDFRFDLDKSGIETSRRVGSLIAAPLLSQYRAMGIIRMDSPAKKGFGLEDLRLFTSIADIAAVAIDNALYYQRTKELAIKDTLTGLYLHNYTLERLEEELKRASLEDRPLSVLMIDIDYFKDYNDSYGHLAGDIVLKSLADWLREYTAGIYSIIGRLGGEEFLVILPSLDKKDAFSLAENMRGGIQEKKIILRRKVSAITVSIGVAVFPSDSRFPSELLSKVDSALYQAKRMGRNRVVLS